MKQELFSLISAHLERYPLMQPQDLVKLLYQGEFGPGHMITDRSACLERLKNERTGAQTKPDVLLTEDIGFGFVRVHLASPDANKLSDEELTDMFMRSANSHAGDKDRFHEKLDLLKDSYDALPFAFTYKELTDCLRACAAAGYPAVSHSELYRQEYHPAYRVVKMSELGSAGLAVRP